MPLRHGEGRLILPLLHVKRNRSTVGRPSSKHQVFTRRRPSNYREATATEYTKRREFRQELFKSCRTFFATRERLRRLSVGPEGRYAPRACGGLYERPGRLSTLYLKRTVDRCHRASKIQVAMPIGTRRTEINWDVLNGVPITPTPRIASPRRSSTRNRVTP